MSKAMKIVANTNTNTNTPATSTPVVIVRTQRVMTHNERAAKIRERLAMLASMDKNDKRKKSVRGDLRRMGYYITSPETHYLAIDEVTTTTNK